MRHWRELTYGIRNLLFRSNLDRDVAEEVEQYYEEAAEQLRMRGYSEQEARRRARLEEGSISLAQERARIYGWENALRSFNRDLRFALRQLWKHPVFTATATMTIALGIGANAAIFTVIESVLLAPLPYAHADHLAVVETHWNDTGKTTPRVTGPDGADVREQAKSFEAASLYGGGILGVQIDNHSEYTDVAEVDSQFARVFSLDPIAGRVFVPAEAHRAALVSAEFARDHFGTAPAALGKVLHIENAPVEITGVLSAGFAFPGNTQIWEAAPDQPESRSRTAFNYKAIARLRQDVSIKAAQAEFDDISRRLEKTYPADNRKKSFSVKPLQQAVTGNARPTLLLLWGAVAIILVIACVNVTHLQLVRSMARHHELAIRRALGSSPWQVIRPVLIEGLVVSLLGAAVGVLLAVPALRVLVDMAPKELPRASEIHLNEWVIAFSLALSVVTAMASSLIPALRAAKVDPAEALKQVSSRGMNRRGSARLRNTLVIAEIAATFVLAMGAALLLRTMMTMMARDMGYDTRRLLIVDADLPAHSEEDAHRGVTQFNSLFAQISTTPGIEHVAGIMGLPTGAYGSNGYYQTQGGMPIDPNRKPWALFSVASPGYFTTMGIPIKNGRDFNEQDRYDGPFVAVLSESLARQSFGSADPIGKQIRCGLDSDKWMTIVGVVGDVRQDSPAEKPGPNLYMPMAQHPYYANQIHVVVRTRVSPLTLINPVQSKIVDINPLIASRFTTMDAMVGNSLAGERFRAVLISSFAGVGLLLAMLGVYGTMAYSVSQRTFEIGIRMAFGAEKSTILGSVLGSAARLAGVGIAIGVVLCLFLTRLATSFLEGIHPMDPLSLSAAAALLVLTALAAGLGPGWRAARVNPMVALRAD